MNTTTSSTDASMPSNRSRSTPQDQRSDSAMVAVARRQQWQDAIFHRLTQAFSLLVLIALAGIIVSLFINAWPTFKTFGFGFLWTVDDGGTGKRFTYRPSSPALAELTDRLAETLERDPLYIFDLMNRHALERLRTSAARTFASAFILGRKKDG